MIKRQNGHDPSLKNPKFISAGREARQQILSVAQVPAKCPYSRAVTSHSFHTHIYSEMPDRKKSLGSFIFIFSLRKTQKEITPALAMACIWTKNKKIIFGADAVSCSHQKTLKLGAKITHFPPSGRTVGITFYHVSFLCSSVKVRA